MNGHKKLIGKTPFLLVNADAEDIGFGLELFQVQIEKDGYIPENFFLHLGQGAEAKVHSNLKAVVNWKDKDNDSGSMVLDYFSREVQAVNNLIQDRKFRDAHTKLNLLVGNYKEVPILYDLQGSLFLLEGQKPLAIKSYEKSLSINPSNVTTREFLKELKGL